MHKTVAIYPSVFNSAVHCFDYHPNLLEITNWLMSKILAFSRKSIILEAEGKNKLN